MVVRCREQRCLFESLRYQESFYESERTGRVMDAVVRRVRWRNGGQQGCALLAGTWGAAGESPVESLPQSPTFSGSFSHTAPRSRATISQVKPPRPTRHRPPPLFFKLLCCMRVLARCRSTGLCSTASTISALPTPAGITCFVAPRGSLPKASAFILSSSQNCILGSSLVKAENRSHLSAEDVLSLPGTFPQVILRKASAVFGRSGHAVPEVHTLAGLSW